MKTFVPTIVSLLVLATTISCNVNADIEVCPIGSTYLSYGTLDVFHVQSEDLFDATNPPATVSFVGTDDADAIEGYTGTGYAKVTPLEFPSDGLSYNDYANDALKLKFEVDVYGNYHVQLRQNYLMDEKNYPNQGSRSLEDSDLLLLIKIEDDEGNVIADPAGTSVQGWDDIFGSYAGNPNLEGKWSWLTKMHHNNGLLKRLQYEIFPGTYTLSLLMFGKFVGDDYFYIDALHIGRGSPISNTGSVSDDVKTLCIHPPIVACETDEIWVLPAGPNEEIYFPFEILENIVPSTWSKVNVTDPGTVAGFDGETYLQYIPSKFLNGEEPIDSEVFNITIQIEEDADYYFQMRTYRENGVGNIMWMKIEAVGDYDFEDTEWRKHLAGSKDFGTWNWNFRMNVNGTWPKAVYNLPTGEYNVYFAGRAKNMKFDSFRIGQEEVGKFELPPVPYPQCEEMPPLYTTTTTTTTTTIPPYVSCARDEVWQPNEDDEDQKHNIVVRMEALENIIPSTWRRVNETDLDVVDLYDDSGYLQHTGDTTEGPDDEFSIMFQINYSDDYHIQLRNYFQKRNAGKSVFMKIDGEDGFTTGWLIYESFNDKAKEWNWNLKMDIEGEWVPSSHELDIGLYTLSFRGRGEDFNLDTLSISRDRLNDNAESPESFYPICEPAVTTTTTTATTTTTTATTTTTTTTTTTPTTSSEPSSSTPVSVDEREIKDIHLIDITTLNGELPSKISSSSDYVTSLLGYTNGELITGIDFDHEYTIVVELEGQNGFVWQDIRDDTMQVYFNFISGVYGGKRDQQENFAAYAMAGDNLFVDGSRNLKAFDFTKCEMFEAEIESIDKTDSNWSEKLDLSFVLDSGNCGDTTTTTTSTTSTTTTPVSGDSREIKDIYLINLSTLDGELPDRIPNNAEYATSLLGYTNGESITGLDSNDKYTVVVELVGQNGFVWQDVSDVKVLFTFADGSSKSEGAAVYAMAGDQRFIDGSQNLNEFTFTECENFTVEVESIDADNNWSDSIVLSFVLDDGECTRRLR